MEALNAVKGLKKLFQELIEKPTDSNLLIILFANIRKKLFVKLIIEFMKFIIYFFGIRRVYALRHLFFG